MLYVTELLQSAALTQPPAELPAARVRRTAADNKPASTCCGLQISVNLQSCPVRPSTAFPGVRLIRAHAVTGCSVGLEIHWYRMQPFCCGGWSGTTEFQLCLPAKYLTPDHTCTVCVQGLSRSPVARNPLDLTRRFSISSRKRQFLESSVFHRLAAGTAAVTLLRENHLRCRYAPQVSGTTVGCRGVRRRVTPARTICHRMACRAVSSRR